MRNFKGDFVRGSCMGILNGVLKGFFERGVKMGILYGYFEWRF